MVRASEKTPSENTALVQSQENAGGSLRSVLTTVGLGITVISLSVGLINFNNWLMAAERFPHAVPLVLIHMICCTCFALLLRVTMPSMFPALTDPEQQIRIDSSFILKGVVPIAIFFASGLVLGNLAYTRLSVAFLQMVKESNIVWTYLLALMVGLEKVRASSMQLIVLAVMGMSLTVHGEMNFVLQGFIFQLVAILSEACKIILQGILLQGKKLDPLSYVLIVSPICGALLACLLGVLHCFQNSLGHGMRIPSYETLQQWAPWLFADACVAFCLNVAIAAMIKNTGPMSYLMCQLVKDVVAVVIGMLVVKEMVTDMQLVGFAIQMVVVGLWSISKMYPENFELGLIQGIMALLGSEDGDVDQSKQQQDASVAAGTSSSNMKAALEKNTHERERNSQKVFEESA